MKRIFTTLLISISLIATSQNIVDFEELTLETDTFWDGSDLSDSGFVSGGIYFPTNYNTEFSFWEGGVAYSNVTDSVTSGFGNLYAAKAGKGADNSNNYAVAYGSGYFKSEANFGWPFTELSLFITNGTYAYNSMRDGDAFAKKFGGESGNDPDYFYVVFKGFRNGLPTNSDSVIYYLADFRFQDNTLDYIRVDWIELSLFFLTPCDSVTYEFYSSDVGGFGINTPLQFCMDNITYNTYVNGVNSSTSDSKISIYPNPSIGILNVDLPNEEVETLQILDATGRIVISSVSPNKHQQLNLENLTNGVYFARFTTRLNVYTNKFILSK